MSNKRAVKMLLSLFRPYVKTIFFITLCLLFSTGISLMIPMLNKNIMDQGFLEGDIKKLSVLVFLVFFMQVINEAIHILKEKKRIQIASKIRFSLNKEAYSHLIKLKIYRYHNTNSTELLNKIAMDIDSICAIADESTFFVVTQIFNITGGILGLCLINYKLLILVLLFIPVKFVLVRFFAKSRKMLIESYIKKQEYYAKWFGDVVGGIREIRLFQIENHKESEFVKNQTDVIDQRKKLDFISQCNSSSDSVLINLLITVLYIVGANMVFGLELSVGGIFAFITYVSFVITPISAILNIGYLLSGIIPSTKRYYDFLSWEEESDQEPVSAENGNIQMEDINFTYSDKIILEHISFHINKGEKVAIVGKNGSGKSTILNLLLRLYDLNKGSILLGGKDIYSLSLNHYRELFAVVNQQIYLFNDSIRNNIKLYKELSDASIMEAVNECGLSDFIAQNGLDYMVGENGSKLSGGQRQKIALVRALVHNKEIILFDEVTSNTDVFSEMNIGNLLNIRLKEKTVIIVTHKIDLLQDMDTIIVLEEGKLTGKGTYHELLKNHPMFRTMIDLHNPL